MEYNIIEGDCLDVLAGLPAGQFQTCITSPPYFGLRDYGTGTWEGGDATCEHKVCQKPDVSTSTLGGGKATVNHAKEGFRDQCPRCGARRVDRQLGLERTPEEYVARLVEVFRQVRRVLRDDATLWLNLGDSYASGEIGRHDALQSVGACNGKAACVFPSLGKSQKVRRQARHRTGLGPKQLLGIPWRVAFALQADGWILRADVVWAKPNAMCESVRDRPTKSHEYLFLLAKQARYFYDAEAIAEPSVDPESHRGRRKRHSLAILGHDPGDGQKYPTRNRRSVWTIPTRPYKGAHFAVFPPALVEPCVLAGTSEAGCCPRCGKAWRRVVERKKIGQLRPMVKSGGRHPRREVSPGSMDCSQRTTLNWIFNHQTIGWQPSCTCEHIPGEPCADISLNGGSSVRVNAPVPCTVLDPFCGAGTTGLIALRHGRRFVGVELNPAYIALARARLDKAAADRPLLALT